MADRLGDGPVDPRGEKVLRSLALDLDDILNPDKDDKEWGFVLIMTRFDETEGRTNYISNVVRADVVTLLREQLARFEGQPEAEGHA